MILGWPASRVPFLRARAADLKRHVVRFASRRRQQRFSPVIATFLLASASASACAADVFISTAPDGSPRYATQALDTSYRLVYGEAVLPDQTPSPAAAQPNERLARLRPIIERVARRHGMSPALVEAVVSVESNLNPGAVSPKGAQGAMQLMPATAARYGLRGPHAWRDPERNIDAGVRHLKALLAQHKGNVALSLAAYNAGASAVARYRGRIPPYRETMLYVPAVLARSAAAPAP
jgi:soluble lytic murein transglycosylase-like protein